MKCKPVKDRCYQNEKCQDHGKFGRWNIIRIRCIKRDKGDGGVISARPVKRPSVQ